MSGAKSALFFKKHELYGVLAGVIDYPVVVVDVTDGFIRLCRRCWRRNYWSFDAASAGCDAARSDGYAKGLIFSSSTALLAVLASCYFQKAARSNIA